MSDTVFHVKEHSKDYADIIVISARRKHISVKHAINGTVMNKVGALTSI